MPSTSSNLFNLVNKKKGTEVNQVSIEGAALAQCSVSPKATHQKVSRFCQDSNKDKVLISFSVRGTNVQIKPLRGRLQNSTHSLLMALIPFITIY